MKKILIMFGLLFTICVKAQEITINGISYNEDSWETTNVQYRNGVLTLNNYEGSEINATENLQVEIVGEVKITTSASKPAFKAPTIDIYGDGVLRVETDTGFFEGNDVMVRDISIKGSSSTYFVYAKRANITGIELMVDTYYLIIGGNDINFTSAKLNVIAIRLLQHDASGKVLFDKCELDLFARDVLITSSGQVQFKNTYAKLVANNYVTDKNNIILLDDSKLMYSNGEKELMEGDNYLNQKVIYIYPPEYSGDDDNPDNPGTGDNIIYWIIMLVISFILIVVSVIVLVKYYGKLQSNNSQS